MYLSRQSKHFNLVDVTFIVFVCLWMLFHCVLYRVLHSECHFYLGSLFHFLVLWDCVSIFFLWGWVFYDLFILYLLCYCISILEGYVPSRIFFKKCINFLVSKLFFFLNVSRSMDNLEPAAFYVSLSVNKFKWEFSWYSL
jgi:hypothetical protein